MRFCLVLKVPTQFEAVAAKEALRVPEVPLHLVWPALEKTTPRHTEARETVKTKRKSRPHQLLGRTGKVPR